MNEDTFESMLDADVEYQQWCDAREQEALTEMVADDAARDPE